MRVRVANTGKHAVRSNDWDQPITVLLKNARPVDLMFDEMSVEELVPPNTVIDVDQRGWHGFSCEPSLMNARDYFDVQLLCAGTPEDIKVTARYAGQTRPMADSDLRRNNYTVTVWGAVTIVLVAMALVWHAASKRGEWFVPLMLACGSFGDFLGSWGKYRPLK